MGERRKHGEIMNRKVIANLAIGTKFLRMALGCMKSAYKVCGSRYEYVIFFAWCDLSEFEVPPGICLVNIESLIISRKTRSLYNDTYRRISYDEIKADGFAARELKGIPFVHPEYIDDEMVYLDADVIVFNDCFEEIFDRIRQNSIVIRGQTVPPNVESYNHPKVGWRFNLQEQARLVGFDITNRKVGTGIVGRSSDGIAKYISLTYDYFLQVKPLPLFPPNVRYFNDEAYFALALSLADKRFMGSDFHNHGCLAPFRGTRNRLFLGLEASTGKPILGRESHPTERDTSYSILHFHTISTWDSDFYSRWLEENVPRLNGNSK